VTCTVQLNNTVILESISHLPTTATTYSYVPSHNDNSFLAGYQFTYKHETHVSHINIDRHSCVMVPRWQLFGDCLRPVFSASCVQHISDTHSKFALRPHQVWKYGRHPICDG